ncbi:MAG: cysteine desulfurase [Oligoflexia bacterium]|nr:cysteine desulfurase [Oligoflexia bacterium]
MKPIYLDYHATTPVASDVLKAMMPYFSECFGNPSSHHAHGWEAKVAVEKARKQVAALLNCSPREIFFTSGATESNNIAIHGIARTQMKRGRHVITVATEHKSVLSVMEHLKDEGFECTVLGVDSQGLISTDLLRKALRPDTILASIMFANNEIGTIHNIPELAKVLKDHQVAFHCDAVQGGLTEDLDTQKLNVDTLSLSGHKLYGPKGIGVLYVKRGATYAHFDPVCFGGKQENGLRPGTSNVAGIVGLGKAAEICLQMRSENSKRYRELSHLLYTTLTQRLKGVRLNGHPTQRLPQNLSLTFEGVRGEDLQREVSKSLSVSAGSACLSSGQSHSHVLSALGIKDEADEGTLRISVGSLTTSNDVLNAVSCLAQIVEALRQGQRSGFAD